MIYQPLPYLLMILNYSLFLAFENVSGYYYNAIKILATGSMGGQDLREFKST